MEIKHITLEQVKVACLKAYREGRLIAQTPHEADYGYRDTGKDGVIRVCAIGAVLSEDVLDEIDILGWNAHGIITQRDDLKKLFDWEDDEQAELRLIQDTHDAWFEGNGTELKFLSLITDDGVEKN